jgi:hypothetical protein
MNTTRESPTPSAPAISRSSPDELSLQWSSTGITLDGPGSYEEYGPKRIRIGIKPGPWQRFLAVFAVLFGGGFGAILWLGGVGWLGVALGLLFAGAGLGTLFLHQETEVTPGRIRVNVRQLGNSWGHAWALPADSECRLRSYSERDDEGLWDSYHAEIRTGDGWVTLAKSPQPERVREFLTRLAAVAGVPIQD